MDLFWKQSFLIHTNSGSTVVEHGLLHSKVEGSSLAGTEICKTFFQYNERKKFVRRFVNTTQAEANFYAIIFEQKKQFFGKKQK